MHFIYIYFSLLNSILTMPLFSLSYSLTLSFLLTLVFYIRCLYYIFFFTIFCISFLSICISCERMWNKLYWIFMMINLYICFIIFIIIVALVCFLSLLYSLSHYVTLLSVLSMFLFVIGSGGPWYDVKATFQMWISYESKYNKNESRCRWRMFW